MALSTETLDVLYMRNGLGKFHQPAGSLQCEYDRCIHDFAHAIEAEVRKQDTELIRQLVEALEKSHATLWEEDDDPARPVHEAIVAGRARLEKP